MQYIRLLHDDTYFLKTLKYIDKNVGHHLLRCLCSWWLWIFFWYMLCVFFRLNLRSIIHTYKPTVVYTTGHPVNLSRAGKNLVNHIKPNSLWTRIVARDVVQLLLLVVMTLKFVPLVPNLRPSSLCLSWMVLYNLLSDPLPILLLENCGAVNLNAFFD